MGGRILAALLLILIVVLLYLLLWPVPIEPVAWQAPPNPGYTGPLAPNERLKGVEVFPIGDNHGPEAIALDAQGWIYAATHEGRIVRLQADGSRPENWVETGGRSLGIRFDGKGNLIVADAFRGLLKIAPDGKITVLATTADGKPVLYVNDLDVAADGKIYFSDASTKFGAKQWGGSHGRLLVCDPDTGKAQTLLAGLNFANGVAVSHDQTYVLVNETGSYRVLRYWISGPRRGQTEPLIEGLPGFPDNISAGLDGRCWVALISPRNKLVDGLSGRPFVRGHIIAIDGTGKVLANLQDPDGGYRLNTSVTETKDYLYIGSLVMPSLGRLSKSKAGL